MKKVFILAALASALSACDNSHEDLYDPDWVREQYENQWEMSFGAIDPNQNWNMAMSVIADVDLGEYAEKDYTINIYSSHPLGGSATLLAQNSSKESQFIFDAPRDLSTVYVEVEGKEGLVISQYCSISNNKIGISSRSVQSRSTGVSVGAPYKVEDTNYNGSATITRTETFYPLSGVTISHAVNMKVGDLIPIVGSSQGVFAEGKANSTLHADVLSQDVVYTINEEGGTVTLTMIYGCTFYDDKFGYFYYKEGEDPMSDDVKKYELIADASPKANLIYMTDNSSWQVGDSELGQLEEAVTKGWGKKETDLIQGTTYRLVYFDENGNSSYGFPKGTKIGFYVYNPRGNGGRDLFYSIYDMNKEIAVPEYTEWDPKNHCISAVTYRYGSATYLGFEDDQDLDMNDVLFFASGDFDKPKDIAPVTPTAQKQSWIVACEDLGSVGDYDFNDIVFKVEYVSGATTATLTPLAAGGTLFADLYLGSERIGEIHQLFGENDFTKMINTGVIEEYNGLTLGNGSPKTLTVPSNFSMSTNMGGFSIKVVNGDNQVKTSVTAPGVGEVPQMICVPDGWRWPTELTNIGDAYPKFKDWSQDSSTNTTWYNEPTTEEGYIY